MSRFDESTGGTAPLMGLSLAIRLVRDRIEGVAATDFTALIEGGISPQPHPGFVEVFCPTPFDDGDRAVAGAGEAAVLRTSPMTLATHRPAHLRRYSFEGARGRYL